MLESPIAPEPTNTSTFSSWVLSKRGILFFRFAGGIVSAILGLVCLIWGNGERPLAVALLALGIFILCHTGVESWFHSIRVDYAAADEAEQVSGFRDFASAFVATSGVILGLLAVFGDTTLKSPFTIKVAVIALVSDILIGTVLIGLLLASPAPNDQPAWNLIRYVFHLALWGLSLGLLCIAMALLYR
jgi:hypothetical protein